MQFESKEQWHKIKQGINTAADKEICRTQRKAVQNNN